MEEVDELRPFVFERCLESCTRSNIKHICYYSV